MKICIIGLGNVGLATYEDMMDKTEVYGVDINEELLDKLKDKGYNVGKEIKQSDVYVIAVYTTQQVFDVLKKLNFFNRPLIIIESTIDPDSVNKLIEFKNNKLCNLAACPHRFNPGDSEHRVFNLNRLLGGVTEVCFNRALDFYKKFMDEKLIYKTSFEISILSKPLENAYRFIEISFAEELKRLCDEKNINFEMLRRAANTKWNIDVKEARKGIDGNCLPKDIKIMNDFFKNNEFFDLAIKVDEKYKKSINSISED